MMQVGEWSAKLAKHGVEDLIVERVEKNRRNKKEEVDKVWKNIYKVLGYCKFLSILHIISFCPQYTCIVYLMQGSVWKNVHVYIVCAPILGPLSGFSLFLLNVPYGS